MTAWKASAINVRILPDGAEYTLAKRDLGVFKVVGVVIMLASLSSLLPFWLPLFRGGAFGWDVFDFIFAAVPTVACLGGFAFGLGVWSGHSQIRVTRDQIQAIEHIGLFRRTWSRPRSSLTGLIVTPLALQKPSSAPGPFAGLALIRAEFQSHRPLMMAIGYPLPLMRQLADELSEQLTHHGGARDLGRDDPKQIAVRELSAWELDKEEDQQRVMEQPANSDVRYEPIDGGTSLSVPAAGWRKGAGTILGIAVVWLAITGTISGSMVTDRTVPWFAYLFMALFWVVGLGLFVWAIRMSRQRAFIDIVGQTLLVTRTGWLYGTVQHEWQAQKIKSVRMGASGTKVNNRTLMQLQIDGTSGGTLGFLTGRDEVELRWIAWVIQRDLGLISTEHPTDSSASR